MNKSAIVGLGLVVVGVGIVLVAGLRLNQEVKFELKKDAQGMCRPSDPEKIIAGYLRTVTWTVTNVDCDAQYVSLRNFHVVGGDGPKKVVKPDPVDGGPIATGTSADVTARVNRLDFWTVYKYDIWNGPTAGSVTLGRDPDIEIWPF